MADFSNPLVQRVVDGFKRHSDRRNLDLSRSDATDSDVERLSADPALRRLRVLNLNGCTAITSEGVKALSSLLWLKELHLEDTQTSDAAMTVVAALPSLTELALDGTAVTDDGLTPLADVRRLEVLYLSQTRVTDGGLRHLGKIRLLRELDLSNTDVGDAGIECLSRSRKLARLLVKGTPLGDRGLHSIVGLPLTHLTADDTEIGDEGLRALGEVSTLRVLNLVRTNVRNEGLKHLAGLRSLAVLRLKDTRIDDDALVSLAGLASLKEVNLSATEVGEGGAERFGQLLTLRGILLNETAVGDRVLEALATLPTLERVSVAESYVSDDGLRHFADSARLAHLNVSGTKIGDRGIAVIATMKRLHKLYLTDCQNVSGLSALRELLTTAGGSLRHLYVDGCSGVPEEVMGLTDPVEILRFAEPVDAANLNDDAEGSARPSVAGDPVVALLAEAYEKWDLIPEQKRDVCFDILDIVIDATDSKISEKQIGLLLREKRRKRGITERSTWSANPVNQHVNLMIPTFLNRVKRDLLLSVVGRAFVQHRRNEDQT